MNLIQWIFLCVVGAIAVSLVLLAFISIREKKYRAAGLNAILASGAGFACLGGILHLNVPNFLLAALLGTALLFCLLFFLPLSSPSSLRIGNITEQVDERDVIFAREEYLPGTEKYSQYYDRRPENREEDDVLRALPELLQPGGRLYEPVQTDRIHGLFDVIEGLGTKVDGKVKAEKIPSHPELDTIRIKALTLSMGAADVGICALNPMYVYSHVGRGPEPWGEPIRNDHPYAIAFSLEMDYFHVERAPKPDITEETARQYLRGAQISIALARTIRGMGYSARAHIAGSNYQIMLPPVAQDAGLGELGRMGYLISPRYGARIRLGAVTTELPLVPDQPVVFGVQAFCHQCRKCAVNCPSGAIPKEGKSIVRGVEKWPLQIEKCLHFWRTIGTDCGLCMKVCPYSHPATWCHNLIRAGIRRSPFARQVAIWGDDLFYGKKARLPWRK